MVNFTDFKKWEDLFNFSFVVKLQFTFELIWTLNKTVNDQIMKFLLLAMTAILNGEESCRIKFFERGLTKQGPSQPRLVQFGIVVSEEMIYM